MASSGKANRFPEENPHSKKRKIRLFELYLWILCSVIISGRAIFFAFLYRDPLLLLNESYSEVVTSFFVIIFPVLFILIFGQLPFEALRGIRKRQHSISFSTFQHSDQTVESSGSKPRALPTPVIETAVGLDAASLFSDYASDSRHLSTRLFNRAGVYLLVGVLVAFSGLAFFYALTNSSIISDKITALMLLANLAPKFGVLFFIELVAFFFLRQYRAAMDEFRYYEALKRHREEALGLIRLFQDSGKTMNPMDLVKSGALFSKAGVLEKGQSSEIIESRKLEKNELDLLEKVIEIVSQSKR